MASKDLKRSLSKMKGSARTLLAGFSCQRRDSKMNKSASLRSNEDKLREAAHRNNLGVIRDLLARRTDPNSRDEVLHSFSDSFALLVDRKYFFFKSDYVFLIH
jgi:hypothetical protein